MQKFPEARDRKKGYASTKKVTFSAKGRNPFSFRSG